MISEIKGMISQSGINLTNRMEDKLTGNLFGVIRYLPFEEWLTGILSKVQFSNAKDSDEWGQMLSTQSGYVVKHVLA